jgi:large subunit ribosomal protein L1
VPEALNQVLEGTKERRAKRDINWERRAEQRKKKGIKDDGPYRNVDETIEFALNLNLDPRKPGQNIRGSVSLPHGTGKLVRVAVFTEDADAAKNALESGASFAGGEELVDQIVEGNLSVDSFDRSIASQGIMGYLSKKLARTLGPRGLMPNAKVGTLVKSSDELDSVIKAQLAGQAQFRTDKAGIIHVGFGKASFGKEKLLDNLKEVIAELYRNKPEAYGKGKKPSKTAIYILKGHLTATQGSSVKLDTRTIDPNSTYYMSTLEN